MKRAEDISGQVIGSWTVLREVESRKLSRYWLCRCVCGDEVQVRQGALRNGLSNKCRKCAGVLTHRMSGHRLYITWAHILDRCTNVASKSYPYYGGRGISFYWENDPMGFITWILENIGDRPAENYSLDRIDNDGDYLPGNLRWAPQRMQCLNQRLRKDNSTGYKGVYKDKDKGKYRVVITDGNHRKVYLGYFEALEDAVAARKAAEEKYHPDEITSSR